MQFQYFNNQHVSNDGLGAHNVLLGFLRVSSRANTRAYTHLYIIMCVLFTVDVALPIEQRLTNIHIEVRGLLRRLFCLWPRFEGGLAQRVSACAFGWISNNGSCFFMRVLRNYIKSVLIHDN